MKSSTSSQTLWCSSCWPPRSSTNCLPLPAMPFAARVLLTFWSGYTATTYSSAWSTKGPGTYRYHPLIKEVLQSELRARDPQAERQLHERAAQYLANLGRAGSAARHLLDAGDPKAAFRLLSDGVIADFGTNPALVSAFDDIQPDDFAGNPAILVPLAAELLLRGDFGRGSRAFELAAGPEVDEDAEPDVAFRSAVVGSMYHHFRGEENEVLSYRDRAHHLVPRATGSRDWLISLDATAAYAYLHLGDFDQALGWADAVAAAEAVPPPALEVTCAGVRGQVAWARGEFGRGRRGRPRPGCRGSTRLRSTPQRLPPAAHQGALGTRTARSGQGCGADGGQAGRGLAFLGFFCPTGPRPHLGGRRGLR